jgi:hypothetical protein
MAAALYWYQHLGSSDARCETDQNWTERWANGGTGRQVGLGIPWDKYTHLFTADEGVIYGVDDAGNLYWHQHLGRSEGIDKWTDGGTGRQVGLAGHWNRYTKPAQANSAIQTHLFAADDGVIYGVDDTGTLHWYQHRGRSDGSKEWANDGCGSPVGQHLTRREPVRGDAPNDWKYKKMFAAANGVLYGVQGPDDTVNGRLYWYRHLGHGVGSDTERSWAQPVPGVHSVHIGSAWNYEHLSAADDDVIYGVDDAGTLYWYRHAGRSDGRQVWINGEFGVRVGFGIPWKNYEQVFAAEDGVIYAMT